MNTGTFLAHSAVHHGMHKRKYGSGGHNHNDDNGIDVDEIIEKIHKSNNAYKEYELGKVKYHLGALLTVIKSGLP